MIRVSLAVLKQLSLKLEVQALESAKSIEEKKLAVESRELNCTSSQESDIIQTRQRKRVVRILSSSEDEAEPDRKKQCIDQDKDHNQETEFESNTKERSPRKETEISVSKYVQEDENVIVTGTPKNVHIASNTQNNLHIPSSTPNNLHMASNTPNNVHSTSTSNTGQTPLIDEISDSDIQTFLTKLYKQFTSSDVVDKIHEIADNLKKYLSAHQKLKTATDDSKVLEQLIQILCKQVILDMTYIVNQLPDQKLLRVLLAVTFLQVFEKFRSLTRKMTKGNKGMFHPCKVVLISCLRDGKYSNTAVMKHLSDPGFNKFCFHVMGAIHKFTNQTETSHNTSGENTSIPGNRSYSEAESLDDETNRETERFCEPEENSSDSMGLTSENVNRISETRENSSALTRNIESSRNCEPQENSSALTRNIESIRNCEPQENSSDTTSITRVIESRNCGQEKSRSSIGRTSEISRPGSELKESKSSGRTSESKRNCEPQGNSINSTGEKSENGNKTSQPDANLNKTTNKTTEPKANLSKTTNMTSEPKANLRKTIKLTRKPKKNTCGSKKTSMNSTSTSENVIRSSEPKANSNTILKLSEYLNRTRDPKANSTTSKPPSVTNMTELIESVIEQSLTELPTNRPGTNLSPSPPDDDDDDIIEIEVISVQTKPSVSPIGTSQTKPSVSPIGTTSQTKPIISPIGTTSQTKPSISPIGTTSSQTKPSISPIGTTSQTKPITSPIGTTSQTKPSILPIGTTSQTKPITSPIGTTSQTKPSISPIGTTSQTKPIISPIGTTSQTKPSISPIGSTSQTKPITSPIGTTSSQTKPSISPIGTTSQTKPSISPIGTTSSQTKPSISPIGTTSQTKPITSPIGTTSSQTKPSISPIGTTSQTKPITSPIGTTSSQTKPSISPIERTRTKPIASIAPIERTSSQCPPLSLIHVPSTTIPPSPVSNSVPNPNVINATSSDVLVPNVSKTTSSDVPNPNVMKTTSSDVPNPACKPPVRIKYPCILSIGAEHNGHIRFCDRKRNLASSKIATSLYLPLTQQFQSILAVFPVLGILKDAERLNQSTRMLIDAPQICIMYKVFFINLIKFYQAWIRCVPDRQKCAELEKFFSFISCLDVARIEAIPDNLSEINDDQMSTFVCLKEIVRARLNVFGVREASEKQYLINVRFKNCAKLISTKNTMLEDYLTRKTYDVRIANNSWAVLHKSNLPSPEQSEVSLASLITSVNILLLFVKDNAEMRRLIIDQHDKSIVAFFKASNTDLMTRNVARKDSPWRSNIEGYNLEHLAKTLLQNKRKKDGLQPETTTNEGNKNSANQNAVLDDSTNENKALDDSTSENTVLDDSTNENTVRKSLVINGLVIKNLSNGGTVYHGPTMEGQSSLQAIRPIQSSVPGLKAIRPPAKSMPDLKPLPLRVSEPESNSYHGNGTSGPAVVTADSPQKRHVPILPVPSPSYRSTPTNSRQIPSPSTTNSHPTTTPTSLGPPVATFTVALDKTGDPSGNTYTLISTSPLPQSAQGVISSGSLPQSMSQAGVVGSGSLPQSMSQAGVVGSGSLPQSTSQSGVSSSGSLTQSSPKAGNTNFTAKDASSAPTEGPPTSLSAAPTERPPTSLFSAVMNTTAAMIQAVTNVTNPAAYFKPPMRPKEVCSRPKDELGRPVEVYLGPKDVSDGPRDGNSGAKDVNSGPKDVPCGPKNVSSGTKDGPCGPKDVPSLGRPTEVYLGPKDVPSGPEDGNAGPKDGSGTKDARFRFRDGLTRPTDVPSGSKDIPSGPKDTLSCLKDVDKTPSLWQPPVGTTDELRANESPKKKAQLDFTERGIRLVDPSRLMDPTIGPRGRNPAGNEFRGTSLTVFDSGGNHPGTKNPTVVSRVKNPSGPGGNGIVPRGKNSAVIPRTSREGGRNSLGLAGERRNSLDSVLNVIDCVQSDSVQNGVCAPLNPEQMKVEMALEVAYCAHCGSLAEMQCSGCHRLCYCTPECQLAHWELVHSRECCPGSG
ncbi:hypothetical protein M8J77_007417 [Diaphorina citri]|nr:hypothetical protein M8J77_007417 [Diaphorina citri]